ncbi:MAG: type 2 isopentenyl-diphosphate Delta-isomerase [Acholeplasma sp.]|nr:type 2 isopentenyl-diphosphate Delta-isomerase [Acholeplasma sp.]
MNRKDEHIIYAKEDAVDKNDFDDIKLNHVSIPNFNYQDVDLKTSFLGYDVDYPIYINAMTGGSELAKRINKKLALYAKTFNLPMVIGSQSMALKHPEYEDTYQVVRKINPDGIIIANVSANASVDEALKAIEMINANGISIHVNLIQELVMNEGDREFIHWLNNIKAINTKVNKPVIVKEVGFGMSKETILNLNKNGIKYIDISGKGGTNFARIERKRNQNDDVTFEHIGISTVQSLLNAKEVNVNVYASGGIRNALDVFKALFLGAKAVGLSKYFLSLTDLDDQSAFDKINELIDNLKKCFVIFGVKNLNDLENII